MSVTEQCVIIRQAIYPEIKMHKILLPLLFVSCLSSLPAMADHARWSDLHVAGCQAQARNSNKEAEEKFRLALLEATQSNLREERAATLFTLSLIHI